MRLFHGLICCLGWLLVASTTNDNQTDVSVAQRRLLSPEYHKFVDPPATNHNTDDFYIDIVYFVYVYQQRVHWLDLVRQQLDEFNCNGLSQRARKIYISISIDRASETSKEAAALVNMTLNAARDIQPKAVFDVTLENRFEYPGIRKVWDIAQHAESEAEAHKTIILYMHSKGMFNIYLANFHAARVPLEIKLFHSTFDRWHEVLEMYHKYPQLSKVGCFPSVDGNIWFNMFYVRASYVRRLVPPTIAKDRYYYEHWLKFIDNDRFWPRVDHIEFAEHDVRRPSTTNSGCADCWSTCQGVGNETLGVTWLPTAFPMGEVNQFDWYKCRRPTVLPRKEMAVSTNNYMHEQ